MTKTTIETPSFSKETRLGLVLYGGISLAVYMNGVSREFYNAVRGRGIYKLIKALTDSDIVVDILSGTSAGGINGVLLSYALANSNEKNVVDFDNFGDIWRESGDIGKLMRDVDPKKYKTDINSILEGERYYQDRLFEAFKKAGNNKVDAKEKLGATEEEWYSDFKELDLFVTGTDVLGRVYKTFDNTGKVIEVKDHRSVFHLKHRRDRKNDDDIGDSFPLKDHNTHQALAKMCRITSCFPVAFPVVSVKLKSDDEVDKKLEKWGNLLENRLLPDEEPDKGYQLHFVDGGVLDNRPFSYTTEAIYYRTAYRPVNRLLFYLDPNPETFVGSPKFNQMKQPHIWEVIKDSLIGLPSYESIGSDLQEIKERNKKSLRYSFLLEDIKHNRFFLKDIKQNKFFLKGIKPIETRRNIINVLKEQKAHYWKCRLLGLRDRVIPLLFDDQKLKEFLEKSNENQSKEIYEKQTQHIYENFGALLYKVITDPEELNNFDTIAESIKDLDFYYAIRKHYFLLQEISDLRDNPKYSKQDDVLKKLALQISWVIELLKVIGEALQKMLQSKEIRERFYEIIEPLKTKIVEDDIKKHIPKQTYKYLLGLFRYLLDLDSDYLSQLNKDKLNNNESTVFLKVIKNIQGKLHDRIEETKNKETNWIRDYEPGNNKNLLEKIEIISTKLIPFIEFKLDEYNNKKATLSDYFSKFNEIDQVIYPYTFLADIQGKDIIKLVRISPNDANRGLGKGKNIDEKLAGDQFRAFGGFFKKSWRSNDILWGRLDGLNRIVDALVTPESLKNFSGFVIRDIQRKKQEKIQKEKDRELTQEEKEKCWEVTPEEKKEYLSQLIKKCFSETPQQK